MTHPDLTHILAIRDRSGSMADIASESTAATTRSSPIRRLGRAGAG